MDNKIKKGKISDLHFDDKNINRGSRRGGELLEKSIREVGIGRSIVIDKNNNIIGGNQATQKISELGYEDMLVVETDGKTLVAVKRTDIDIDSPEGAKMKILDNTVSRHNYVEDADVADAVVEAYELDADALGLETKEEKEPAEIKEEELRPFRRTHVLLSFPPEKLIEIQDILQQLSEMDFIEYEQASN